MTDPFSLASGAVGIISFGLTVCQGIVTYCSSWKDRDKETSNVAKKAEGLRDTLEALRDLIEGGALQNDPVLSDVKDKILACEGGMHELKKKLETCTGVSHSSSSGGSNGGSSGSRRNNFHEVVRAQGKKALHPF